MKQITIIVILLILVIILGILTMANRAPEQASAPMVTSTSSQSAPEEGVNYEQSKNLLVGQWQSSQDSNGYKVFEADGTTIERYVGEQSVETAGTWRLFNIHNPVDSYQQSLDTNTTYLRIDDNDEQYHYAITNLDENTLELIYLGRGGILQYQRVVN